MMKAFSRSSKSRPLHRSDLVGFKIMFSQVHESFLFSDYIYLFYIFMQLYFPTFYEDHWFVFVVDIKDKKFVFLDSFYSENHAYQQYVRQKMVLLCLFISFSSLNIYFGDIAALSVKFYVTDSRI